MEVHHEIELDNSTYFVEEAYTNENQTLDLVLFDVGKYHKEFGNFLFKDEIQPIEEISLNDELFLHLWKNINVPNNLFNHPIQSRFFEFNNGAFINANNNAIAKRYRYIDWSTRSRFYNNNSTVDISPLKACCVSYHVNVGHGNCTFITDGTTSIGIDCSAIDFRNNQRYHSNITACIQQIKNDFNLNDFKLDYFVLTHPHYD